MRTHETRRARCGWAGALCLLLAPALLLGAFLGGDALLVHAHGAEGRHYHVVSGGDRARHAHHEDHEHHERHGPAREERASAAGAATGAAQCAPSGARADGAGLVLAFPVEVQAPVPAATPRCAPPAVAHARGAPDAPGHRLEPAPTGAGPPGRRGPAAGSKQRSGIAIVVAASHAIRI